MLQTSQPARPAVFLDRDGVINRSVVVNGKPYPPANLAAMEILPQVPEALEALSHAGFLLIVITNQPDVARGTTSQETVEEIHNHLAHHLPIQAFYACYHLDEHQCDCRKPAPGALLDAANKHHIDLAQSYMVGDRWRDIEAGQRAGCKTIFIDYGYDEKQPTSMNFSVQTLMEATHIILGDRNETR
ncbi:MAG: HAD family hydrolase [Legionellaceae bacterium]|nr:HAD family hydrolase [Legionellaceae bacterium]